MRLELLVLALLPLAFRAACASPADADPLPTRDSESHRTETEESRKTVNSEGLDARSAWRTVDPEYSWSFPRDHGTHPGFRNEWWYFVGHLADSSGNRFGYQLTLFRIGIAPAAPELVSTWTAADLVMGHLALTDVGANRHIFAEALYRATPLLGGFGGPDSVLAWCQAPPGTAGQWTIRWDGEKFDLVARDDRTGISIDLAALPSAEPLLQGPNGYSRKSGRDEAASHYYSVTRLETRGVVGVSDSTQSTGRDEIRSARGDVSLGASRDARFFVTGTSWMDHEFSSNQLGTGQVGWDWFSIQLDDGRDVMMYLLRNETGIDYAHGTLRERDGTVRGLGPEDWILKASGARNTRYPSRWNLEIPNHGIEIELVPLVLDQENVSTIIPGLRYWEGAVEVRAAGRNVGQGYVELTGYGDAGRLPF